jgi:fructose-bisphosphate aldolase class 1
MNSQLLKDTVKLLFADNKGLLAMDESTGTCNKRFAKLGIPLSGVNYSFRSTTTIIPDSCWNFLLSSPC